ncbi:reverse transcriptase domain-containing protein [Tanacetum coccineum]|uniref:Reverse transcriptase domain-containing protein n=1 Tax=Tanacetum coccineum TaxID=301880 RepID=A0ABQ5CT04_9ASTR
MVSNQIRPPSFSSVQNPHAEIQTISNRGNNFNQNRGNNFNQGQIYRPPVHQPVVNQPVAHQGPAPQTHGVSKTDFERYVTANDAVLRNMQNQGQNLQSQMANLTDMLSKFVTANTASTSGSGTLLFLDTMPPANNGSTEDVQPPVVQIQSRNPNPEPNVAPVVTPVPKASIPFPSRRNDERRKEKANDQIEKFYEIFRDLSFKIKLLPCLDAHFPKFAKTTLKTLIGNKEKLSELARTPLNENCSAVILNKLPKKLGDPGRFLIPCEFTGITTCNALADLGASINLMPYSVWKNLSLPELTPTCMTLELADRSITEPIGIAEDVFVNVGKFQFPADFVVVDFEPDPRVPLILGRCFLKTSHALIDVYEGPRIFKRDREMAIPSNICPIVFYYCSLSPYLTPSGQDPEGDILILEAILNSEPPHPLPNHEQYMPGDLKDEEKGSSYKDRDYEPYYCAKSREGYTPKIHDVIKKEVEKLLDAGLIYPISDSPWVSPVHCVPKIGGMTVITNEENEPIPTRLVTGWRIPNDPKRSEKTTFTCPYGTLPYRSPCLLELSMLPGTFQRCMMAIFHDMIEKTMEVFNSMLFGLWDAFLTCPNPFGKDVEARLRIGQSSGKEKTAFSNLTLLQADYDELKPHYTTTEKEYLPWGLNALRNFVHILVMSKSHSVYYSLCHQYLVAKKDAKARHIMQVWTYLGEHYGATTHMEKSSIQDSIGPPSTRMPMTLSPVVTFVNVKEKLRNVMRCHKTPSKFAKSLTSGALILWGRSRLQEGTNTYSWLLTTCQNGLKQKRSPPMMPELSVNF